MCMHEAVHDVNGDAKEHGKSSETKPSWWDNDCRIARNRNRLYFYLWKSAGRPLSGQVYEIYKNTRKT